MSIKAVAFDIDGTMYPNYKMLMHSVSFFLKQPRLVLRFNEVRKELRKIDPIEDFYTLQARLLGESMGMDTESARGLIQRRMYRDWERIFTRIPLFPLFKQAVVDLKQQGYKLGVLSDFPPTRKISLFGLDGLWDVVMGSEETGYLKPHSAPFLALAEKLDVAPESVLYVGNSYRYDVEGARKAGMKTVHITRKPLSDSVADLQISDYKDFARQVSKFS